MQALFHLDQFLYLALHQFRDRYTGPLRDYLRDILLLHFLFQHLLALLEFLQPLLLFLQLLLQGHEIPIAQPGRPLQVCHALRAFDLQFDLFDAALYLTQRLNGLLLALPLCPHHRALLLEIRQFLLQNPYEPEGEKLTPEYFLGARLPANAATYGGFEIGRAVVPSLFPPRKPDGVTAPGILSAAITLIALLGLAIRLRAGPGAVELYTAAYLAICLAWPEVWGSIRFLLPVIPMILYAFWTGLSWVVGRIPRLPENPVLAALVLLLLVGEAEANVRARFAPRGYPGSWRNYFAVADWVRDETPESAVICCRKPYLFYVRARRRTVSYLWSYDPEKVFAELLSDDVDYVVLAHLSATTGRYLLPAIRKHEDRFDSVLHFPRPDTYLLRLREVGRP